MRYYTYSVGAYLVNELDIAGAVDKILHDGRDIIHLRLVSGESLMIHLIDSSIPLYEIKNTVTQNTMKGDYTLFIVWSDMLLHDHGTELELEDWHKGLLALYDGKIYGYKIFMQRLYVFPVYFDKIHYTRFHRVRYGDPIDVGGLRCYGVDVNLPEWQGAVCAAAFDGDPDAYHKQRAQQFEAAPPDRLKQYYDVLGIPMDADRETIKAAFRELARQHHPDINTEDEDANEKMQQINVAYGMILRAMDAQD